MANEIHRKRTVALTDFDFGTSFAEIDSLADQDICWSAPVTTCDDEDVVWVSAKIKVGTTPIIGSTIEFFVGRGDDGGTEKRSGTDDIDTTDHGTEGTDADVDRVLGTLGPPVYTIPVDATTDKIYTAVFPIHEPGADFNLFIHNNTGAALNGTSSPHSVSYHGKLNEIQ